MIILILGGTHTGKTLLAQKLLERHSFPYLSIDHLKMGLIRSGRSSLTPQSDEALLTGELWPVVREIIKTAVENKQNLIVEGCYIPAGFMPDFDPVYLRKIRHICLIFSENYIRAHYNEILAHSRVIEDRPRDCVTMGELLEENRRNLELCKEYGLDYILIDESYSVEWDFMP